jgi:hypothetical protein
VPPRELARRCDKSSPKWRLFGICVAVGGRIIEAFSCAEGLQLTGQTGIAYKVPSGALVNVIIQLDKAVLKPDSTMSWSATPTLPSICPLGA